MVHLRDGLERLLAGLPGGRILEHLEGLGEAERDRSQVQVLLRPEEPEEVGLRNPGAPGDLVGRGAVEAPLREQVQRDVEDLVAALIGGSRFVVAGFMRGKLSLTHNRVKDLGDAVEIGLGQARVERQRSARS